MKFLGLDLNYEGAFYVNPRPRSTGQDDDLPAARPSAVARIMRHLVLYDGDRN